MENNSEIHRSQESHSTIVARITMFEQAFVQLVNKALKRSLGEKLKINGFDVVVKNIEMKRCQIDLSGITQNLVIDIHLEKPQGWLPISIDTQVLVYVQWRMLNQGNYPSLDILDLKLSASDETKVGVLNFNIGVPKVVKKKVFDEIVNKKIEIQNRANKEIKTLINKHIKKPFKFKAKVGGVLVDPCVIDINQLEWKEGLDSGVLIADVRLGFNVHLIDLANETEPAVIKYGIEHLAAEYSEMQLDVPFSLLIKQLKGLKLPLGKLGQSAIRQVEIKAFSDEVAHLKMNLQGDVNGDLDFKIKVVFNDQVRIALRDFRLNLENKIFDFGASLFESTIEKRIQTELNAMVDSAIKKLDHRANEYLSAYKTNVEIGRSNVSIHDMDMAVLWKEDGIRFIVRSDAFAQIKIKTIPDFLLAKY